MRFIICLLFFYQNEVVHSAVIVDVLGSANIVTNALVRSRKNPHEALNYLAGGMAGDFLEYEQKQSVWITYDEFANGVQSAQSNYPRPSQEKYDSFMAGLPKGDISTKEEAAMALAQILHESDGLQTRVEYEPEDYSQPGCDVPGKVYYGRGYIQLTGCDNYRRASMELYNDDRLHQDPDLVAREESVAWDVTFHYWKWAVHTSPEVLQGQFGASTERINGPNECRGGDETRPRKRYAMYGSIRAAWGLPGPGIESGCYN